MSDLSSPAARLVRAGIEAARPSEADRTRIFEALRARLGDAAMVEGAGVAASKGLTGALWVKVSAATVGLGLLIGGLVVALQPTPQVPVEPTPALQPQAAAPPVSPRESSEVAPIPGAVPSVAAAVEPPAPAARRPSDRLTQEVALLSRATNELHSGRAAAALKTLDEHRRSFPNGVLSEERRAGRAQALCALGRRSEAEEELARLARSAPRSIQVARARQACGVR